MVNSLRKQDTQFEENRLTGSLLSVLFNDTLSYADLT
jgi:hypothetical protein